MSHDFEGLRAPEQCVRNILLRKFDSRICLSRIESFDDSRVVALRRCTRIIDKLPEQAGYDGRDRAALFSGNDATTIRRDGGSRTQAKLSRT